MKKSFLMTVVLLALMSLTLFQPGCTKDSDQQSSSSIEGLWIGSYTTDGQPNLGQQYFSFVIKPDGTLINDTKGSGQQHLNIGTWTLSGDAFSATAVCVYGLPANIGIQENHTATFNKSNGTFTGGKWKNVAPLTGSGTFTLTKVN